MSSLGPCFDDLPPEYKDKILDLARQTAIMMPDKLLKMGLCKNCVARVVTMSLIAAMKDNGIEPHTIIGATIYGLHEIYGIEVRVAALMESDTTETMH